MSNSCKGCLSVGGRGGGGEKRWQRKEAVKGLSALGVSRL